MIRYYWYNDLLTIMTGNFMSCNKFRGSVLLAFRHLYVCVCVCVSVWLSLIHIQMCIRDRLEIADTNERLRKVNETIVQNKAVINTRIDQEMCIRDSIRKLQL